MLEQIKNGELTEYKFFTPLEVDGLIHFIAKNDLHNTLITLRFLEDTVECDFYIDDIKVTCKSLKGYRYNHSLTFFRAK